MKLWRDKLEDMVFFDIAPNGARREALAAGWNGLIRAIPPVPPAPNLVLGIANSDLGFRGIGSGFIQVNPS